MDTFTSIGNLAVSILPSLRIHLVHYTHIDTHNHLTALFLGLPGWASARRNFLLDFMVQGQISEADTPTIWLDATPSGLISNPTPSSPILMPDALSAATLPIYPGLGQALYMLACTPNRLVTWWIRKEEYSASNFGIIVLSAHQWVDNVSLVAGRPSSL